jgi:ribosomal protein L11
MDKFEVLKNEKYNVGKIQKQRINIVSKTKGKALKQKDIKEIVKKLMLNIYVIKKLNRKY